MNAVLVLFALAAIGLISTLDVEGIGGFVWVFMILVIGPVFQIAFHCYHWGGRLAINQPLTLDGWGLEFQGQQGTIKVPWEAVPEVRRKSVLGQQQLTFMLHPQAVPGQNGVEADPHYWPRYLKKGLALGNLGLVPGFETILPAIQHYSQGRTRIV